MNHILSNDEANIGRSLCGLASEDWAKEDRYVFPAEEKDWRELANCPACLAVKQNEEDLLLGRSIRKLLESEKRELYPHAAESWHARVTLKRYDPGCDGLPGGDYRCHVGDDMCRAHATLDEAVAVALSGKYKNV